MQETVNLLKEEFLTAYERNAEFRKVKFNKSSIENYSGIYGSPQRTSRTTTST